MVIAASTLEQTLSIVLLFGRLNGDGGDSAFEEHREQQRRPASALLNELTTLGLESDLAAEIAEVISARNAFVHRLFSDPEFIQAFGRRSSPEDLVSRIDKLTQRIDGIVTRFFPDISNVSDPFWQSVRKTFRTANKIDPGRIDDMETRVQLEAFQALPDDWLSP